MKYEKGLQGLCMWSVKRLDEGDELPYLIEFIREDGSHIEEVWLTERGMEKLVLSSETIKHKPLPMIKRGNL